MWYWFLYRPLPKTSGRIPAPIGGVVSVSRDELGVAHIAAETESDALFVQGYVTAQDRLFQMDLSRRRAAGELAEILGPSAVRSDQEARGIGMRRIAEQHYASLAPEDRAIFAAYARGVNFFLDAHRNRLPIEFVLLDYDPRPWSVTDSVLVGLQMYRTLSTTWDDEFLKYTLLREGEADKVDALFPVRTGRDVQPGSNAWVLSGRWTHSGKPLLASDPHLAFSVPCAWYQVHLKAPGLNVAGMTLPGLPAVVAGHNERIAWGATNLRFDVQDLYVENLDPRTGRYAFKGTVEQARLEREPIVVKGERPVEASTWVTRHGPVVVSERKLHLALRWTAAEPSGIGFPFLAMNRARNWEEFRAALRRFPGPAQNFVYADVDGNIGYQAAGMLPMRTSHAGDVPVDGASGEHEWNGFIPFEQLPSMFNPPSGVIVTANQNPFPEEYPHRVSGSFAPPDRARQIRALLTARNQWRAEELLGVQMDVYSAFLHVLARQLVEAYDGRGMRSESLDGAVDLLRNWNGQMEKSEAAALVATLLYQHLRKAVAERASPGAGARYAASMAPAVVERLLRNRPEDWFQDYDQLLLRSLVDAIEEGRRMQGDDVSQWDYGKHNELLLPHPVVGRLPFVGRYFRIGPAPMDGSSTTVKQTTPRMGPSMRMVVDLSDWDRSLANITLGQTGQPLSSHYQDQWEAYDSGSSYPMQYQRIRVKDRVEFAPAL